MGSTLATTSVLLHLVLVILLGTPAAARPLPGAPFRGLAQVEPQPAAALAAAVPAAPVAPPPVAPVIPDPSAGATAVLAAAAVSVPLVPEATIATAAPADPAAYTSVTATLSGEVMTVTPADPPQDITVVGPSVEYNPEDPVAAATAEAAQADAAAEAAAAAAATAGVITPQAVVAPLDNSSAIFVNHNIYRRKHVNTSDVTWSAALALNASAYAAKCIWAHDPQQIQGENMYGSSNNNNTDPAVHQETAVRLWWEEIKAYNYANPVFSDATGHFTQLVWRSSTKVGCAYQYCPNGMTNNLALKFVIVCRYTQKGNAAGQFANFVMPLASNNPQPSPSPSPKPSPKPSPSPSPVPQTYTEVLQGAYISSPSSKASPNGIYKLYMQSTGKTALIKVQGTTTKTLWSAPTTTSTGSPFKLMVESTGMLSIFNNGNVRLWSSNTANPAGKVGPYKLRIQNDGNVRLLDSRDAVVWQTGTAGL